MTFLCHLFVAFFKAHKKSFNATITLAISVTKNVETLIWNTLFLTVHSQRFLLVFSLS